MLSLTLAIIALIVAGLSWHKSHHTKWATLFRARFEIFRDAEHYIARWRHQQHLDDSALQRLISAWNRSHFVCSPYVTEYLQALWFEGIDAAQNKRVIEGEAEGDPEQAREAYSRNLRRLTDSSQLREVFKRELRSRW